MSDRYHLVFSLSQFEKMRKKKIDRPVRMRVFFLLKWTTTIILRIWTRFFSTITHMASSEEFDIMKLLVKCIKTNEPPHEKTNKVAVRPAKTQISLGIRPD